MVFVFLLRLYSCLYGSTSMIKCQVYECSRIYHRANKTDENNEKIDVEKFCEVWENKQNDSSLWAI